MSTRPSERPAPTRAASSSQTKKASSSAAGQAASRASRAARVAPSTVAPPTAVPPDPAEPRRPILRTSHAPTSCSVLNGSSHDQAGPSSALTRARPTQPKTHRMSEATSASLFPPATVCSTTQVQAARPSARRQRRAHIGSVRSRPGGRSGGGLPSLMATKTKESPTAMAAPTR